MPEIVYINMILKIPQVLNMPKPGKWKSSEYGSILNMRALHSILNMLEYAFIKYLIYLGF